MVDRVIGLRSADGFIEEDPVEVKGMLGYIFKIFSLCFVG